MDADPTGLHLMHGAGAQGPTRSRWKVGLLQEKTDDFVAAPAASRARRRPTPAAKPSAEKYRQPRPRRIPKWGRCLWCGRAMRLCFGRGDMARPFLGCPAFKRGGDSSCTYATRVPDHLQHQLPGRVVIRQRIR